MRTKASLYKHLLLYLHVVFNSTHMSNLVNIFLIFCASSLRQEPSDWRMQDSVNISMKNINGIQFYILSYIYNLLLNVYKNHTISAHAFRDMIQTKLKFFHLLIINKIKLCQLFCINIRFILCDQIEKLIQQIFYYAKQ